MKVFINYRVLQSWRAPVFRELSSMPGIELLLVTGQDFPNTKVVNTSQQEFFEFWNKLPILRLQISRKSGNVCIPIFIGLFYKLIRFKPDIVVSEGLSNLHGNLICFIYCKIFGVPFIHWGLGSLPNKKRGLVSKFFRKIADYYEALSSGAIAYGSFGKEHYVRVGIPHDCVVVALNTVDVRKRLIEIDDFLTQKNVLHLQDYPEKNEICYLGALEANKHVSDLLKLFLRVKKDFPNLVLRIIGDGSARPSLEDLVETYKISDVIFVGNVKGALAEHLLGSKCLILPNLGGLVFSEALVHGIPILSGPADGTEKDFLSHQPRFMMPKNLRESPEEWLTALHEILSNTELRTKMRRDGIDKISNYSAKSYAQSICGFLKKQKGLKLD